MRILFLILIVFSIQQSNLLSQNFTFEIDHWDKEKTNLLNEKSEIIGYFKQDYWDKNTINFYDQEGNILKKYKKDYWDKERQNIYNQYDNLEGSMKIDYWHKNRRNFYDDEGNIIGYSEPDKWNTERTNEYNANGTLLGYYERDKWNSNLGYNETSKGTSSKLDIYAPEPTKTTKLEYVPTQNYNELDFSSFIQTMDDINKIQQQYRNLIIHEIENAESEEEREAIIQRFRGESNNNSNKSEKPSKLKFSPSFEIKGKNKTVYFPKVDKYDNPNIQITKIDLKKNETIIHVRYINNGSGWIRIGKSAFIYDKEVLESITDVNKALKYIKPIKDTENIPFDPDAYYFKNDFEIHEFSLIFPKINWEKTKIIDMYECEGTSCFNAFGIHLE